MNPYKRFHLLLAGMLVLSFLLRTQTVEARRGLGFSATNEESALYGLALACVDGVEFAFTLDDFTIFSDTVMIVVEAVLYQPDSLKIALRGPFTQTFTLNRHDPIPLDNTGGYVPARAIAYSANDSIPDGNGENIIFKWSDFGLSTFTPGDEVGLLFSAVNVNANGNENLDLFRYLNEGILRSITIEDCTGDAFPAPPPTCVNEKVEVHGQELQVLVTEEDYSQTIQPNVSSSLKSSIVDISGRLKREFREFPPPGIPHRFPYIHLSYSGSPGSVSADGYIYSYEWVAASGFAPIELTVQQDENKTYAYPKGLVFYDTYATSVESISIVRPLSRFVDDALGFNTAVEHFAFPSLEAPTTISVTAIYIDNQAVTKPIRVSAAAGNVTASQTDALPNIGSGLNIIELTLENVPAGTSSLDFTIESPEGTGDAALLTGIVVSYPCLEPNTDPIANDDTATVSQDSVFSGPSVLANDSDPDGDPLTVESTPVTAPAHGELTLSANGTYTYTPTAGFFGNDSFVYRAVDGNGGSATATVALVVTEAIPIPDPCAPVTGNLLTNGAFTTDQAAWNFYTSASGQFTLTDDANRCAKAAQIRIDQSGSNVQLYQHGIPLEANTLYRLRFAARSSSGQDLAVLLHNHTAPYENYGLSINQVNLTIDWTLYTVDFTTASFGGAVDDARLRIWLAPFAQAGDQYWLDDVSLVKQADFTDDAPANPTAVITTADGLLIGLSEAEFDRRILERRNDGNLMETIRNENQLFLPLIEGY